MGNATLYGSMVAISAAVCFLRSGIIEHLRSRSVDVFPPNNYFIGLGALLAGIGMTMLIIEIKYYRVKDKSLSVVTIY
jgi:hypothetical protein